MGATVGLSSRFGQLLLHMSIWRGKLSPPNPASDQLRWSDPERVTLAEIGKRVGSKPLREIRCVAQPDRILAWHRKRSA